jgi:hypothetical protein
MDRAEPNLATALTEIDDPSSKKSNTETDEPEFMWPKMLMLLPNLVYALIDKLLPSSTHSNVDTLSYRFVLPKTDRLDPSCAHDLKDREEPIDAAPSRLKAAPDLITP